MLAGRGVTGRGEVDWVRGGVESFKCGARTSTRGVVPAERAAPGAPAARDGGPEGRSYAVSPVIPASARPTTARTMR
jgi:hypothetical protein